MIPIGTFCDGDLSVFAKCLPVARLTICECVLRATRLKRGLGAVPAAAAELLALLTVALPAMEPHAGHGSAPTPDPGDPAGMSHVMHHDPQPHDDAPNPHQGHEGHDMAGHCPMHMWFFFSSCVVEMFSGKTIDDLPLFVGYLGAIVIAMILYEILKLHRDVIFQRAIAPLEAEEASSWFTWYHFYQTLLHALQLFSSYLFMLLFMTFNAWVCLAVVLGVAIGYFLVGWRKTEHTLTKVTDDCCY